MTSIYTLMLLISLQSLYFTASVSGISPVNTYPRGISLKKVWETKPLLRTPESVVFYNTDNVLFVSNINGNGADKDMNGFISKVSLDGKVETLHWATGLSAPKGMGISGNKLYVTDIDRLVMLDITSGAMLKSYPCAQPAYLNDVSISEDGVVYVSDNRNDKIYHLQEDSLRIFLEGEFLQNPNGIWVESDKIAVGSGKTHALQFIDLKTKKLTEIANQIGAPDGVVAVGKSHYFVSDWNGRIFWISSKGEKKLVLDTTGAKISSADIAYIPSKKLLLVPTFHDNRLAAYRVR